MRKIVEEKRDIWDWYCVCLVCDMVEELWCKVRWGVNAGIKGRGNVVSKSRRRRGELRFCGEFCRE